MTLFFAVAVYVAVEHVLVNESYRYTSLLQQKRFQKSKFWKVSKFGVYVRVYFKD